MGPSFVAAALVAVLFLGSLWWDARKERIAEDAFEKERLAKQIALEARGLEAKAAAAKLAAKNAAAAARKPAPARSDAPKKTSAGGAVTTATVVDEGGVRIQAIQIDRFAIPPNELPLSVGSLGGRAAVERAIEDARLADEDPAAIALVGAPGMGKMSLGVSALEEERQPSAVSLELGASTGDAMDPEVARTILVHLFEVERAHDVASIRARYEQLVSGRIALLLRDASRDQAMALVPDEGTEGSILVTTATPLGIPGVHEVVVGNLDDEEVRSALSRRRVDAHESIVAAIAGHPMAITLAAGALSAESGSDAGAFRTRLEGSAPGLEPVLEAALAVLEPILASQARALSVLATGFDLFMASRILGIGEDETFGVLRDLVNRGLLAPSCRDKFNRERAEVPSCLRVPLRERLARLDPGGRVEHRFVATMATMLTEEEERYHTGPSKRAPALYLLGLDWPSFDRARRIALARAEEDPIFRKGCEHFAKAAPTLFGLRPAMAAAWGRG